MDKFTIIVGGVNTLLPKNADVGGRKLGRKSKDIVELITITNQRDIITTYRLLHPTVEYTFYSSSHGAFTETVCILSHKTHLNQFILFF